MNWPHPTHGDIAMLLLLVFLGGLLFVLVISPPDRAGAPEKSVQTNGFGPEWDCISGWSDPFCVKRPMKSDKSN